VLRCDGVCNRCGPASERYDGESRHVLRPDPLTVDELNSITAGGRVEIPAGAPEPNVDARTAEATVRATYRGTRETIDIRRIAIRLASRVLTGWVVGLTPEAGVPCVNHPGLQPRAVEGGIVNDQTGEMFWTMTCF
jgi:hypothetical protein